MYHVLFFVTDSRQHKPFTRNFGGIGFNLPADPGLADKGRKGIIGIVKRVVDERRSKGKPGPFAVKAFTVEGDKLHVNYTSHGPEVVGGTLVDDADTLTQEDVDAMARDWEFEQNRLRTLASVGAVSAAMA